MKFVVVLLALIAVVLGQDAAICNNGVTAESGSYYSLAPLTLTNGGYYSWYDTQTGITYFWNTCAQIADLCGDDAAACYSVSSGEMNAQSFFRAGAYDNYFYEVFTDSNDERVEVTFYGGEVCADLNKERQITFAYHCDISATTPNVTSVDNNQDCGVTIHMSTTFACGVDGSEPGYFHHFHYLHKIMIFVWIFVALSACICCCACCAILRRRRCQNRTGGWCKRYCSSKKGAYTELSTVETPAPISQPQVQPTAPIAQQPALVPPQFFPVQYIPAQQYYMMQQQFMQQQQLVQQQQQQPVVELENVNTDVQVDADEKLARELQAQFNAEH
jgi:hypothetical protein